MRTVWKYSLELKDRQTLLMPAGAKLLHLGTQPLPAGAESGPVLWVEVDPAQSVEPREFFGVGTGHNIPDDAQQYVGTMQHGRFVWHVFERRVG